MDMETTTLITLAWELHTQGLSKSCIAERLGKDRSTIRLWITSVTEHGLLPFLEQHQKAKKQPFYSGKKKTHTLKTQVAAATDGSFQSVGQSVPGSARASPALFTT